MRRIRQYKINLKGIPLHRHLHPPVTYFSISDLDSQTLINIISYFSLSHEDHLIKVTQQLCTSLCCWSRLKYSTWYWWAFFYFKFFCSDKSPFCEATGTLWFWLLVDSALGFKSQGGSTISCDLFSLVRNDPQSQLWPGRCANLKVVWRNSPRKFTRNVRMNLTWPGHICASKSCMDLYLYLVSLICSKWRRWKTLMNTLYPIRAWPAS